jgi:N-succinyl-L-ornithine transcarbamylase
MIEYDQNKAFENAFVYTKNWSNYNDYGQITSDPNWTVTSEKMALTNNGKIHALLARKAM